MVAPPTNPQAISGPAAASALRAAAPPPERNEGVMVTVSRRQPEEELWGGLNNTVNWFNYST